MILYNKLVRDRIPEIIEASGKSCKVRRLGEEEYREALKQKLGEELAEYSLSGEVAELADLVETVYALVSANGVSPGEFEDMRRLKREDRGGFGERLLLMSVED